MKIDELREIFKDLEHGLRVDEAIKNMTPEQQEKAFRLGMDFLADFTGSGSNRGRCTSSGRRGLSWTKHNLDKLNRVREVLGELAEYKPLTLRQVYYQLVGKGYIENTTSEYTTLSKLLKYARIDGYIDWDEIEDRVRTFNRLRSFIDLSSFVTDEREGFLKNYVRDIQQGQPNYIEVWIEKDALRSVFTRACYRYNVPVVVCRGFSSVTFLNEFRERLEEHSEQEPVMLYFGDFDPSGMEMLPSMQVTLEEEMDVEGVEFKRIALTRQDVEQYQLPHDPRALKSSDTRAQKHVAKHGELAVELDALRPDVLSSKVQEAIENELDIDRFNAEVDLYKGEMERRDTLLDKLKTFLDENLGESKTEN